MNHIEYLSKIGTKGGKGHRPGKRRMSEIARLRWAKAKKKAKKKASKNSSK